MSHGGIMMASKGVTGGGKGTTMYYEVHLIASSI
jgi:hypothetical protein